MPALESTKSYPLLTQAMNGCGKYGSLGPQYTEILANIALSTYYTNNDLTDILSKEPFWD